MSEANIDPVASVEAGNSQTPEAVADQVTPATETPEAEGAESQSQGPKGVGKRIAELVDARNEARQERDHWRELAMRGAAQPQVQQPVYVPPTPVAKPTIDAFQTQEAYLEALAGWHAEAKFQNLQRESQAQVEARQKAERAQSFVSKAQEFAATHDDFDVGRVTSDPTFPCSDAMAEVIQSSEQGAALLYHLDRNRGEAARLYGLSPVAAARELGLLEARLTAAQPRRNSNAPPPINPLSGTSETPGTDPGKMTDKQWLAWRQSQLRRK